MCTCVCVRVYISVAMSLFLFNFVHPLNISCRFRLPRLACNIFGQKKVLFMLPNLFSVKQFLLLLLLQCSIVVKLLSMLGMQMSQ